MGYLNGYTLIALVIVFIVFLNTLEIVLLNGGTVEFVAGLLIICLFVWFIVVNLYKWLTKLLIELESL